ncbi:MAG: MBL fold metallo-hydrolase [Akkermansia sp.]|nr:MBL fold metallo-hydrolase [Akkermansia sp.]
MKIHVLIENTSTREDLQAEHGLSLLIEACGQRILFDAGASAAFAANAEKMGVDLRTVDACVLSHGHNDHGGGLATFLQHNPQAAVWVSPLAFEPHFNAVGKNIGLSPLDDWRIHVAAADITILAPGVELHRALYMPTPYAASGQGMETMINGERVSDDFRHEQYLLVEENGVRILFSGCSHRGVLNIVHHFRPDVLIGGFHFMKYQAGADDDKLREAAELMLQLPTRYYTGHCTGEYACNMLKPLMGERLQVFSTGDVLHLG